MTIDPHVLLIASVWLAVCAVADLRTRRVANYLTLPALGLSLAYRLGLPDGLAIETLLQISTTIVVMFAAWRSGLLGGADLKILAALSLVSPLLLACAWAGAALYLAFHLIVQRAHQTRFAGFPGFAFGVALLTIVQVAATMLARTGTS
jgi:Flp pilus assembly protein protease CpaA